MHTYKYMHTDVLAVSVKTSTDFSGLLTVA